MKTVIGGTTTISARQLRTRELFSVERVLSARGLRIVSEGGAKDTLLDKDFWTQRDLDQIFQIFENPSIRADLLDAVKDPDHVPTYEIVSALASQSEFRRDRQRYSTTFEWFIGELLIRKFMAFSSSFGVSVSDVFRNSDGETSGDYDVLSVLGDMSLLYVECKTGHCPLPAIFRAVERSISLHSAACVILLDAPVSRDKLLRRLRRQLSGQRHPRFASSGRLATIETLGLSESEVFEWFNCFFVQAGETGGNVESKFRTVMRLLAAYRSSIFEEIRPEPLEYRVLGYNYAEYDL